MPSVFCSAVIAASPDKVWATVKPFDNLKWGTDVNIEIVNGKANDQVGARRIITMPDGGKVEETLVSVSDLDRSFTYLLHSAPFPTANYKGDLRCYPVTDTADTTFVTWGATWDAPNEEAGKAVVQAITALFSGCLAKLKASPPK